MPRLTNFDFDLGALDFSFQGEANPMTMLLLATTALVGVTSVAFGGPLPTREPDSSHYGFDANQTFLCNYGSFDIGVSWSGSASSSIISWRNAAVPVTGNGKKASGIVVADQLRSGFEYYGISVAIYSSRHNKPFKLLSRGSVKPSGCGTSVPISPIKLKRGNKYWIVESLNHGDLEPSATVSWFYRKTHAQSALFQSGYSYCNSRHCHRHSGNWETIMGGVPYARIK